MSGGGSSPYDKYGYIKEGKIFHLDGIDKGEIVNAWTDLVGGWIFTKYGSVVDIGNGWDFPGANTAYFHNANQLPENQDSTIEVCFWMEVYNDDQALFSSANGDNPHINGVMLFISKIYKTCFLARQNTYTVGYDINTPHCISLNLGVGCYDGTQVLRDSSTTYWGNNNGTYIGKRNHGVGQYPYNGIIYSIRVYNRRLSLQEMQNNQRVDNQRFNLGLNI